MAVDENGTLWGWGRNPILLQAEKRIFESSPIRIMEDVAEIQLGNFSAAALKTDGTLWLWGTTGYGDWEEPRLVLDEVASVYSSGNTVFAIRTNGDLYGWGSFELEGRENVNTHSPAYIASGIKDISSGGTKGYQCLTTDGQVFLFGSSGKRADGRPLAYTMDTTPVAEQVRSLCEGGFVKKDNSFWTWEWAGAGSPMVLEKQRDDVAYAAREDCFVTTDGRLHAQGLWFPVSLYGLSTFVRNLFFISVLCVIIAAWIRKKLHK